MNNTTETDLERDIYSAFALFVFVVAAIIAFGYYSELPALWDTVVTFVSKVWSMFPGTVKNVSAVCAVFFVIGVVQGLKSDAS